MDKGHIEDLVNFANEELLLSSSGNERFGPRVDGKQAFNKLPTSNKILKTKKKATGADSDKNIRFGLQNEKEKGNFDFDSDDDPHMQNKQKNEETEIVTKKGKAKLS